MDKSKNTTVNFIISVEVKEWLEQRAREEETTLAAVARSILRKAMNNEKEG